MTLFDIILSDSYKVDWDEGENYEKDGVFFPYILPLPECGRM